MRPSFLGLAITGILSLIALIVYIIYFKTFTIWEHVQILLLLAVAFGVHSILHEFEEIHYDFNPLANKWKVSDVPIR